MEKVLLVASIVGSIHLFLQALRRFANQSLMDLNGHAGTLPADSAQTAKPDVRLLPAPLRKDGEEDWSTYDIPTFLRRGIPMPKLEVVPAKKPAKRRKVTKKSAVEAPTETAARFEVLLP